MIVKLCTWLFKVFLILYPPDFRCRFGDEMIDVFGQVAANASNNRFAGRLKACLCELSTSVCEAFRQRRDYHQHLRPKSIPQRCRWEGPPSTKEIALALAAFLAPASAILAHFYPPSILALSGPLVIAFVCAVFFAGIIKGLPRWSLPYLGLVLSGISFMYLFNQAADLSTPYLLDNIQSGVPGEVDHILLQAFWAGFLWLGFFVLVFLILGILLIWHRFQMLFLRLRQDWTQVSFILYNGSYLALLLFFGHSSLKEAVVIASLFSLAIGSFFYLHCPQGWQRMLALLAGISLAMFIGAAGEFQTMTDRVGANLLQASDLGGEFLLESGRLVVVWCWLVVLLLAPGILNILPPPKEPSAT